MRFSQILVKAALLQSRRHQSAPLFSATVSRPFSDLPSPPSGRPSFGIAFDIDGVILRGNTPIGGSPNALRRLYDDSIGALKVPYVFLTNGGGVPESKRAFELSKLLGVNILPSQVIQGHTPFKQLLKRFENEFIIAVGKGEPAAVMSEYGFKYVLSIDEYASCFDNIDPLAPYKKWTTGHVNENSTLRSNACSQRVQAVFIVSDSVDWSRDIQVTRISCAPVWKKATIFLRGLHNLPRSWAGSLPPNFKEEVSINNGPCTEREFDSRDSREHKVLCDILRTGGLPGREIAHQPPLYFAHDDLQYQAVFPCERFGMGAFRIALESIFNSIHPNPLQYTTFGKPNPSVFRNAENLLTEVLCSYYNLRTVNHVNGENQAFRTLYMVGDNPSVDIKGARQAGHPWFSILTRTGVFKGKGNHTEHPADLVVDTVEEAVDYILRKEGI